MLLLWLNFFKDRLIGIHMLQVGRIHMLDLFL